VITTLIALVAIGFIGWWATGIDDTLALGLLLRRAPTRARPTILTVHILSVVFVLAVASAITLGLIQFSPDVLNSRIFGIPVQNMAGLLPMGIGLLALRDAVSSDDDDDNQSETSARQPRIRRMVGWAILGAQVYLANSLDDLAFHLGVLGGVIHPPVAWSAVAFIAAFWIGNLAGEFTSLAAAHWLGIHFKTRRLLEICAALTIIAVGGAVLLLGH